MKIRILNDIHLEWYNYTLTNPTNADVLVLSGDIMLAHPFHDYPYGSIPVWDDENEYGPTQTLAIRFRRFLETASRLFKHVVYVAGNHEFYHGKFHGGIDDLKNECNHYSNIHYLENEYVMIDGYKFIGCTLWTDLNNYHPLTEYIVKDCMADYKVIKNDHAGYRKLLPKDTVLRHEKSVDFIKKELAYSTKDKVIICTHHAPSFQSIDEKHIYEKEMNGAYCSKLEDIILDNTNILLWTHGHIHAHKNYMIGETNIICNPRGYMSDNKQEYTGWDEFLTVEINEI